MLRWPRSDDDNPERPEPDLRIELQRSVRGLGLWTMILYGLVAVLLVLAIAYATSERNRIEDHQEQVTVALCNFREDIQRRYDTTVQFIVDHPDGIPGISVADLQRSADNLAATLQSLRDLPCPPIDGTEVKGRLAKGSDRARFVDAINRERGCADVRTTGKPLLKKARRHSVRMARQDRLFHSQLSAGTRWSKVGEVVGVGPSWQVVLFAFFESRRHRFILRDCDMDFIAVGIVDSGGRTWVTARLYAR
jgi:hypothetical protein